MEVGGGEKGASVETLGRDFDQRGWLGLSEDDGRGDGGLWLFGSGRKGSARGWWRRGISIAGLFCNGWELFFFFFFKHGVRF